MVKLTNWSKRCYLTPKSPGEESKVQLRFSRKIFNNAPNDEESKKALKNFS